MSKTVCRWFITVPPQGAARSIGNEVIRAFQAVMGNDSIKTFDCGVYLQAFANLQRTPDEAMTVDLLNQSMVVQCLDFQATHVLTLALSPITVFSLNVLRKYGMVTVHWFYEDFRAAVYWKDVVGAYSFFLAIQRGPIVDLCNKTGAVFALVPTAAHGATAASEKPDRTLDVAFIGVPSAYRVRVLELLASRGIRLGVAGLGWERYRGALEVFLVKGGWTNEEESARLLGRARIGINLSITDPQTDRTNTHLSPRAFDIMHAGCVLVTEATPLTREILTDCRYHEFSSAEEAIEIIAGILKNYEANARNIRENMDCVQRKHVFRNRVETIISLICGDSDAAGI